MRQITGILYYIYYLLHNKNRIYKKKNITKMDNSQ